MELSLFLWFAFIRWDLNSAPILISVLESCHLLKYWLIKHKNCFINLLICFVLGTCFMTITNLYIDIYGSGQEVSCGIIATGTAKKPFDSSLEFCVREEK